MTKRKYVVLPGKKHGANKQYTEGDIVLLTWEEAEPFLDKLRPISEVELTAKEAQEAILQASVAEKVATTDAENLGPVPGFSLLDDKLVKILVEYGFATEDHVAAATDQELLSLRGIGPYALTQIRSAIPEAE